MGPKKRKGSPSKSEPGGSRRNDSLLKSAIAKSRSEKNTSVADLSRSTRSASIVDITNIPHRSNMSTLSSSSLDGTAKKRGKALAAFKQFQETVTPRTAMAEFMEAHQSSVQTPAMFFPPRRPASLSGSGMGSYVQGRRSSTATHINASSVISDISDNVVGTDQDISTLSSDVSTGSEVRRRTRRRDKSKGGVTLEDVDPDRDITRPTNMSRNNTVQDMSSYPLSDESANETMEIKVKRRTKKKKEYLVEDFDFSIAYPGSQEDVVPASNTHSNTGLGRTMADSVYQVDRSLDITDEVAEKLKGRREKMARRQTRHQQQVEVEDFSGLDTPPQKKDGGSAPLTEVDADDFEVEGDKTLVAEDDNIDEVEAEIQDAATKSTVIETKVETSAKLSSTHGVTLGDISQEEETPVPTKRKRTRRGNYQESVGKEFNFTEIETPETSFVEPAVTATVDPVEKPDAENETGTATEDSNTSTDTPTRKDRSRKLKDVDVEDFGGISLASAQPNPGQSEEETPARKVGAADFTGISVVEQTRTAAVQAAVTQATPGQTLISTNLTMGLTMNDEETPVPTKRKRTRRGDYQQQVGKEFNFTEVETPETSIVEVAVIGSFDPVEEPTPESLAEESNPSTDTPIRKVARSKNGKTAGAEDFSGISVVEQTRTEAVQAASTQPTPGQTLSSTNYTMGLTVNEEETPVRKTRGAKQKMIVDVGDFTDISIAEQVDEQEESPAVELTVAASHTVTVGQTLLGLTTGQEETPVPVRRVGKKKMTVEAAEFTDISMNIEEEKETEQSPNIEVIAAKEVEKVGGLTSTTIGHTMLGFTVNEEETPVRTTRATKRKVDVGVADFTDISVQNAPVQLNEIQLDTTSHLPITENEAADITVDVLKDLEDKSGNFKSMEDSTAMNSLAGEEESNSSQDSIRVSRRQSVRKSSSTTLPYSPLVNTHSPSSRNLTNKMRQNLSKTKNNDNLSSAPNPDDQTLKDASARSNPWEDDTTDVAPTPMAVTDSNTSNQPGDQLSQSSAKLHSSSDTSVARHARGEHLAKSGENISREEHYRLELSDSREHSAAELEHSREDAKQSQQNDSVPKATGELLAVSGVDGTSLSDSTSLDSISLLITVPAKRGRARPAVGVDIDEFDISLPSNVAVEAIAEGDDEDTQPLSQEEKEVLFSETKARRAARKSEVLGHFVRAPNLSNIVETSEVPSRPNSGLRTSSEVAGSRGSMELGSRRTSEEVAGSRSSMELASRRTSEEVRSGRKSSGLITSIVEEKEPENNDEKEMTVPGNAVHPSNEEDLTDGPATKSRKRASRRSLYRAGLPEQPMDSSMLCDQTRVFRPEVESTRLGNMTGLTDLSPVQEATVTREGARPGRDTSTPDISKTRAKARVGQEKTSKLEKSASPPILMDTKNADPPAPLMVQSSLVASSQMKSSSIVSATQENSQVLSLPSEPTTNAVSLSSQEELPTSPSRRLLSYLPSVPSKLTLPPADTLSLTQPNRPSFPKPQQERRLSKTLANKSLMSVTSGTQYETPEQVREARKSSRRSNLRMSLYTTRLNMDDIAEGGTQTTPTLELTTAQPPVPPKVSALLSETGCQVTPGLTAPQLQHTVLGQDRDETPRTHLGVEEDSISREQVMSSNIVDTMTIQTHEKSVSVSTSTSPIVLQTQQSSGTTTEQTNTTAKEVIAHKSFSEEYVDRNATAGQMVERILHLTDGEVRKRRVENAKVRVEINELNDKLDEAVLKKEFMVAEKIKEKVFELKKKQVELEKEIETREVKVVSATEEPSKELPTTAASLSAMEIVETNVELGRTSLREKTITEDVSEASEEILNPEDNEKGTSNVVTASGTVDSIENVDNDIGDIVKNISAKIGDEDSQDHFEENNENQEWAYPQYNQEKSQELINSFAEVDIDDGDESEHESSGVAELNITGRKNPSPVLERRPEVDVESDEDDFEDGVEGDSEPEAEPHNSDLDTPAPTMPTYSPNTSGPVNPPAPVLPDERVLPSNKERKEMRQATLARYLGIQDSTARQGLDTLLTPQQPKKKVSPPAKMPKVVKPGPKTTFPVKNIKFEYNRFSRFKVKKDAEQILTEASQDFMELAMARLSDLAKERGAEKIHLCDIRRLMGECGFVKPMEEDPANRYLNSTLREVVREDLVRELIPCSVGDGTVYPPADCWKEKGGKKSGKKSSGMLRPVASGNVHTSESRKSLGKASGSGVNSGKGSAGRKADKVKRFQVAQDLDTTEPKRPRLEMGKNGGKGRKNRS